MAAVRFVKFCYVDSAGKRCLTIEPSVFSLENRWIEGEPRELQLYWIFL